MMPVICKISDKTLFPYAGLEGATEVAEVTVEDAVVEAVEVKSRTITFWFEAVEVIISPEELDFDTITIGCLMPPFV